MKYSLRSLMIVAIIAPPLLAGLWSIGASAIVRLRMRYDDEWENVGGPGLISEFRNDKGCRLVTDECQEQPPLLNSQTSDLNPSKP